MTDIINEGLNDYGSESDVINRLKNKYGVIQTNDEINEEDDLSTAETKEAESEPEQPVNTSPETISETESDSSETVQSEEKEETIPETVEPEEVAVAANLNEEPEVTAEPEKTEPVPEKKKRGLFKREKPEPKAEEVAEIADDIEEVSVEVPEPVIPESAKIVEIERELLDSPIIEKGSADESSDDVTEHKFESDVKLNTAESLSASKPKRRSLFRKDRTESALADDGAGKNGGDPLSKSDAPEALVEEIDEDFSEPDIDRPSFFKGRVRDDFYSSDFIEQEPDESPAEEADILKPAVSEEIRPAETKAPKKRHRREAFEDFSPEEAEFTEILPEGTDESGSEEIPEIRFTQKQETKSSILEEGIMEDLSDDLFEEYFNRSDDEEKSAVTERLPEEKNDGSYDFSKFGGEAVTLDLGSGADTSWLDSSIDNSIFYPETLHSSVEDSAKTRVVPIVKHEPTVDEFEPIREKPQPVAPATESVKSSLDDSKFNRRAATVSAGISEGYIAPSSAASFKFDDDSGMDFGPQDDAPTVPQAPVRHISPGNTSPLYQTGPTPSVEKSMSPILEVEDFADEPVAVVPERKRKVSHDAPAKQRPPKKSAVPDPGNESEKEGSGEEKKKSGFFTRNFIIVKGDSTGNKIRKIIMCISILAIIVSVGYLVYDYVLAPYKTINQINELNSMIGDSTEVISEEKESALAKEYPGVTFPKGMLEKYASLYARNPDFVGWLKIDGLGISLPVVQGEDNTKYLKTDFDGKPNKYGSLFMNCSNNARFLNRNTTIFGHDMKDIKMFGSLIEYKSAEGYKKAPVIEFNTIYGDYKWKVFAVFITNGTTSGDNGYLFNYIYTDLSGSDAFEEFLGEVKVRSIYYPEVDIAMSDRILTLSTCTYEFNEARLVILARMMRSGENETVNVANVKFNPNPRYPAAYYAAKSLSNPYASANKWYPS